MLNRALTYWIAGITHMFVSYEFIKDVTEPGPGMIIWMTLLVYLVPAYLFYRMAQQEGAPGMGLGNAQPWFAFVPGLNVYLLWLMTGKRGASLLILMFIPIVCAFAWMFAWSYVCERRGVSRNAGVLMFPAIGIWAAPFLLAYLLRRSPTRADEEQPSSIVTN